MADGKKHAGAAWRALFGAALAAFVPLLGACAKKEPGQQSAAREVTMKTVVMPVEGMSCSACAASVKKALTSIDGVANVEVNLAERNARVRFDPSKLSPDRLVAAVNGLGYQAGAPAEVR
jgi:copper chaperone CopZ